MMPSSKSSSNNNNKLSFPLSLYSRRSCAGRWRCQSMAEIRQQQLPERANFPAGLFDRRSGLVHANHAESPHETRMPNMCGKRSRRNRFHENPDDIAARIPREKCKQIHILMHAHFRNSFDSLARISDCQCTYDVGLLWTHRSHSIPNQYTAQSRRLCKQPQLFPAHKELTVVAAAARPARHTNSRSVCCRRILVLVCAGRQSM